MKMKKFSIVHPEIEIEFARPIIGRLYFALIYPMLIKIKRCRINVQIKSYNGGMAGTISVKNVYFIAIPKVVRTK